MAIITPGPLAAAVSGSIGGTTFSRNRGGAYVRNRAIPVDPNTIFQINVRAILASQSQNWADLTNAQRTAWESWSLQNPVINALGNAIRLSGHQAFVQINARLDFADLPVLNLPPIVNAPLGLDSMTLTADIGVGDVEVAFTATPTDGTTALWTTAAVVNSAGVTYVRNLLRQVQVTGNAISSPQTIQASVESRLGTLIVGQTLHVRVATFSSATGLLSIALADSAVVVSTV